MMYEVAVLDKYLIDKYIIINGKYKGWFTKRKYGYTLLMNDNQILVFSRKEIQEIKMFENGFVVPKKEIYLYTKKGRKNNERNTSRLYDDV